MSSGEPSQLVACSLPAETLECRRRLMRDIQRVLVAVFFFFQQNDLDDNNMHRVADGRVLVQGRNHVHDRQQVRLDVATFMELHH